MVDWHNTQNQICIMATRNNTRSNAARNESKNAANNKQQVNNPATQEQAGTPVPAKAEDLEARLAEYTTSVKDLKKKSQKASENLAKMRDMMHNQAYVVAVSHLNMGKATVEDLQIIASRKAADNAETGLAKAIAAMPKDTEDVAKARELAKSEEGSLTSAIAETERCWNTKGYALLYGSIGLAKRDLKLIPTLLKGICPYLQVATADGIKAATITRTAVRKNGKAIKQDGKRVYKYTLRERTRWSAYGLFETLERNHYFMANEDVFSAEDLRTRNELLNAEVKALAALKAAKEAEKSDVPEQAADAHEAEGKLAAAAKAAGKATKQNATDNTQHTTVGGKEVKVA